MTVMDYAAFREMRDAYQGAASAAEDRGDALASWINQNAAADLRAQVKPPRLLPDNLDDLLVQRAEAHVFAMHAAHRTALPYAIAARQGDYARRLDAVIDAWDKT